MKNVYAFLGLAAAAAAFLCSCNKEIEPKKYDGPTTTVTVRAVLPEEDASKVVYMENDEILLNAGIDSQWENGDCFYAIVSNQNADTGETEESVIKFNLTEGAGTPVGTFQAEVPSVDANTTWTAVFGHFSSEVGEAKTLKCTYDGQDGTISNLQAYDFIVAYATGEHPEFNFTGRTAHGEGRDTDRLTYFLRIKLPAGIRYIEYCTATDWSVSAFNGNVPSNEEHFACVKDLHPGNWDGVSMIDLGDESDLGDVCYLAIPACQNGYYNTVNWNATQGYWSENPKGLIITFFSGDMRKSNGKVINSNLKAKGGFVGTSDLTGMELIDRPLADEAVFLGSSTVTMKKADKYNTYNNFDDYVHEMAVCPEWAPFNLGAKANPTTADEVYGDFFCWGETAPRTEFSEGAYTYNGNKTVGNLDNFSANMLGVLVNYSVYDGENTDYCTLQRISGTKYDAARVRWGSEWRMPIEEEFYSFTGGCRLTAYNNSVCQNKAVDSYNGVRVNGRQMGPDGNSVFFPFCGCYGTSRKDAESYGYYWSDTRLRGTPSNRNLTNNPLRARFGSGMEYASNNLYDGLAIRPVRNYPIEKASSSTPTVAEEGFYNAYGYVEDNSHTGIAGVAVSDGYTTVLTDSNGKYEMVANPNARYVYVSVPAEYEIPMTTVSLQDHDVCTPAFYKLVTVQEGIYSSDNAQNFGTFKLTPRASVKDRVTLIAVTDAHVRNISGGKEVQSAHNDDKFLNALLDVQETAQTLENGIPVGPPDVGAGEIIGITLGDQNWDGLETYSDIIKAGFGSIKSTEGNPVPFFFTIGNHDYQSGDDSDDYHAEQHFIEHFGPTNYSFNVGNVHFIVMDNIVKTGEAGDKIKHTQKFTEEQITWIKSDVAKVSNVAGKICVLCLHAPLTQSSWDSSSDRQQAVMSTIKKFKAAHVFSGHTHSIKNNLYRGWACKNGRSIYEHTLQALCGAWWDADVTRDGSPAGYGVFTFDQNDIYAEYNKVTKEDPDFQIRSYDGSTTYNRVSLIDDIMHGGARGYKAFNWDSPVRGKFLCRVWDASPVNDTEDTWSISLTYNGSNKGAMTAAYDESEQLNAIDACVASFLFNDVAGPYGDYSNMETHPQMFYSAQSYGSSSFTITATHTMRSGWSATYTSSKIVNNYKGFRSGENYDR